MNFSFKKSLDISHTERLKNKIYFKIKFIKYEFSFKNAHRFSQTDEHNTNNKT